MQDSRIHTYPWSDDAPWDSATHTWAGGAPPSSKCLPIAYTYMYIKTYSTYSKRAPEGLIYSFAGNTLASAASKYSRRAVSARVWAKMFQSTMLIWNNSP